MQCNCTDSTPRVDPRSRTSNRKRESIMTRSSSYRTGTSATFSQTANRFGTLEERRSGSRTSWRKPSQFRRRHLGRTFVKRKRHGKAPRLLETHRDFIPDGIWFRLASLAKKISKLAQIFTEFADWGRQGPIGGRLGADWGPIGADRGR